MRGSKESFPSTPYGMYFPMMRLQQISADGSAAVESELERWTSELEPSRWRMTPS